MSVEKIKQLKKKYPDLKDLNELDFDEINKECEVWEIAKMKKLPFKNNRTRATKPLQCIHADTMGPIQPETHPKGHRFVVICIDDYSRLAMTYPMKNKTEVADALRSYIVMCRNLHGSDLKVCYSDCDQDTEFTGKATGKVLEEFGAELRTVCPGIPQLNGMSERFN